MKRVVLGEDERVKTFASSILRTPVSPEGVAIGLEEDGRLIAATLFDMYNGASIAMHVAAVPGCRWITREYLAVCFGYPFAQLGVRKIIGLVSSANRQAQRFDEHLGFVLEGTLKDAHPDGDLLLYSMSKEQCRWLNIMSRSKNHGWKILPAAAT